MKQVTGQISENVPAGKGNSKNVGQFVKKEQDECDYVKYYGYCDQNSKKRIKCQEGSRQSERLKETKELGKELVCNCKSLNCPVCDDKYASKKNMLFCFKYVHSNYAYRIHCFNLQFMIRIH